MLFMERERNIEISYRYVSKSTTILHDATCVYVVIMHVAQEFGEEITASIERDRSISKELV